MTALEKLTAAASLLCWAIAAWLISPTARAETYPGPYRIEVIRVIDGQRAGWCSTVNQGTGENTTTKDRALKGRVWPTKTHKPAPASPSSERLVL